MSLKEYVAHELGTLGENELKQVAEYVSFLKFRSRTALDGARLAALYAEFEAEDQALAEAGMHDYAHALTQEDAS